MTFMTSTDNNLITLEKSSSIIHPSDKGLTFDEQTNAFSNNLQVKRIVQGKMGEKHQENHLSNFDNIRKRQGKKIPIKGYCYA